MCGVLDGFRGRTLPNEEPPTSSSSRRRDPSRASRGDLRFECGLGGEATTPARGDELLGERMRGVGSRSTATTECGTPSRTATGRRCTSPTRHRSDPSRAKPALPRV